MAAWDRANVRTLGMDSRLRGKDDVTGACHKNMHVIPVEAGIHAERPKSKTTIRQRRRPDCGQAAAATLFIR
jgi:hypothetical protein